MGRHARLALLAALVCAAPAEADPPTRRLGVEGSALVSDVPLRSRVDADALALALPSSVVTRWRDGRRVLVPVTEDAWLVDLGEAWVPPLLDDGSGVDGSPRPSFFRETYVALARHEWPDTTLGRRAAVDGDLDNYGIPPALSVLRERFRRLATRPCDADLAALARFDGLAVEEDEARAPRMARDDALEGRVLELLARHDRFGLDALDDALPALVDLQALVQARPELHWRRGLDAARRRLQCEGFFGDEPLPVGRDLDARTRRALEGFERRHRIYSRGSLSGATLDALRLSTTELARRDLVRVVAERIRLELGILEDGSAPSVDGVDVPNLEQRLRDHVERALGLTSFESALAFLEGLELTEGEHERVAIDPMPLPAWYAERELDIEVEIDRGDQWYEPPFDEEGEPRSLPVEHRPTLTLFVRVGEERVPLVQWPTTVGGWNLERRGRRLEWQYKESPAGEFAWPQVVGAPVWLPPINTPASDLVTQRRIDETGHLVTETKDTLLGPGYASAYGLVAGMHRPVTGRDGDRLLVGRDQGIRTHGSVDYTSVWRRASHGCHRLHNHRALALFSFILAHRAHRRVGHSRIDFHRSVEVGEETYRFDLDYGGYVFQLDRPVPVTVLPGRVLGDVSRAPRRGIPVVVDESGDQGS
ncbi:MAG: L,D-transpeptidase [Sandaracinus sp.]|nr:L,D-transpeptidase [Sandaracinus sp.]